MNKRRLKLVGLLAVSIVLLLCFRLGQIESDRRAGAAYGNPNSWMHRVSVRRDLSYGDSLEQRLDLYLQGTLTGESTLFERARDRRPTLLFIHGGGWVARDWRPEPWLGPFVEQGWHAVTMTYRLGPRTAPLAVDDSVCALNWIAQNAEQYGFDLDRIVVAGVSAGGHLALTAGILGSRPGHACFPGSDFRVHSIINWAGITNIEAIEEHLSAADPEIDNYALSWIGDESGVARISAAYSPVNIVDGQSPPVVTIHGTSDTMVPFDQAVEFHDKLESLGIRNELLLLEGGADVRFTNAHFGQALLEMLGIRNEQLSIEAGTHARFTSEQFSQALAASIEFVDTNRAAASR